MPYQNENRAPGPQVPQHQSMRVLSDRPGMSAPPRPSPTHGHPQPMNPPFSRHDYHHQPPPRHLGSIPSHYNDRPPRGYPVYSPAHGIPHRQSDEHINQQYAVSRRGPPQLLPPPQSPRSNTAPSQEAPPHVHGPPLNLRRNPQFSYGQGFYEYGDYSRPRAASDSHSPSMRPTMRDCEDRRFIHRPNEMQHRHHMTQPDLRHRSVIGPSDRGNRHSENWRVSELYEKEYNSNHPDDNILPPPEMQRSPQYRIRDRVFQRPLRAGHPNFDQRDARNVPFDRSQSNSDPNTDDELCSSPRSNEENNPGSRDEMQNIGCTCKKSKCLKLYCQCFASKIMCCVSCRCMACKNTPQFESERNEAVRSILLRNPNAFDTKFKATAAGKSSKVTHKLGCKCRKSACLKKYCECYNANVKCSSNCRCVGCQNMPENGNQGSGDNSYVPTSMMDAARDLAGLKCSPPRKLTSDFDKSEEMQKVVSPPRVSGPNQDLYPVPTLTVSDTQSKEEDTMSHEYSPGKQVSPNEVSPRKDGSVSAQSSSVEVLLSAAYALTELQSAARTPEKTSLGSSNGNLISPSPKRKLNEMNFQEVTSFPSKRSQQIISETNRKGNESLVNDNIGSETENKAVQIEQESQ